MRQLALLSVASFAAVAVAACGTAPGGTETTESTAQDLFIKCPPGQQPQCSWDSGRKTCQCEAMPAALPTCNWVEPPPGVWGYIQSWSVASPDGTCPDIPVSTADSSGVWKNLQPVSAGPYEFDGVPCEVANFPRPKTCSSLPELASGPCCTYVWWPNGFVQPQPGVAQSSQDGEPPQPACAEAAIPGPMCGRSGMTFYATVSGVNCAVDAGADCRGGGGSSCSSCCK